MHTSTLLTPADFSFERRVAGRGEAISLAQAFPDYHPQDRVAVVWSDASAAVVRTGVGILALTTAFYESLRQQQAGEFFDYPQHFSLEFATNAPEATPESAPVNEHGRAWSMLDVWPECKRKTIRGGVSEALAAIFELQINRVFWPASWWSRVGHEPAGAVPNHIARMLRTSLKQTLLYRDADGASASATPATDLASSPSLRVAGTLAVTNVLKDVYVHLPESRRPSEGGPAGTSNTADARTTGPANEYVTLEPSRFLAHHARCFAPA